jgi:integrase
MRREWVKGDVFAVPLLKVTEERDRIYEPQEVGRLLEKSNQMWNLRIRLGYQCGMRRAEVLHLKFSDCNFRKKLIHIQPSKDTRTTLAWEPKGKSVRTLPMTEEIEELLHAQREELLPDQPYACLTENRYWTIKELIKTDKMTDRIRSNVDENFSTPFQRIVFRARIPYGTFHDLRKTYGTMMAEAGMPQHELAYLMGHHDSKVTEQYYIKIRRHHVIERARKITLKPILSSAS